MKKVLIVALSLSVFCTACSTAWVSTLDSILAAAAPALINILQIVAVANGQPMNSNLQAKINAAPGFCSQLNAAVGDYQADQALVLEVAQVQDPNTQTKITVLADLVAGTVQAITAVIPSCNSAASFRGALPYSLSTFIAHYNSILVAPTGNKAVDAEARKLQLHQHSTVVRAITFGRLN